MKPERVTGRLRVLLVCLDPVDDILEDGFGHFDEVGALGEAALLDIVDVFTEGGDPFLLEFSVFFEEVAVGFGVAGEAFFVVAEDIAGEEELGIASAAGSEGHEDHFGLGAEERGEVMGYDFEFGGVGAGVFEVFHLPEELLGFPGCFSYGAVIGPGDVAWDHAEVSDYGDTFTGHAFDDVGAGGAVD